MTIATFAPKNRYAAERMGQSFKAERDVFANRRLNGLVLGLALVAVNAALIVGLVPSVAHSLHLVDLTTVSAPQN